MKQPGPDDYMGLLHRYEQAVLVSAGPNGTRLELLFAQVVRLLALNSPFNSTLPAPFRDVARRHNAGEAATIEHFRYDENRQFFLNDLHDYIRLHAHRVRDSEPG